MFDVNLERMMRTTRNNLGFPQCSGILFKNQTGESVPERIACFLLKHLKLETFLLPQAIPDANKMVLEDESLQNWVIIGVNVGY